jgi:NodT family efflux transporter outer membrane factor (OMF) lipoprotein
VTARLPSALLAPALLIGALGGCSLAPAYAPPAIAIPNSYAHEDGWAPAAPADGLSRGPWWERFGDPVLNGLEAQIEGQNPQLAAALARYDQARGFEAEARAGQFPTIGAEASASANRQSADRPLRGAAQPNNYGAQQLDGVFGYELDLWGRVRNEVASRKALAQASNDDTASVRLSLQAELADDYMQLRGLDAQAELLRSTIDAYQKAYDLTETLYQGKVGTVADVSRAQTQLSMAKAQLSDATASRALLEHAAAVLVGRTASDFNLPAATPDLQPPPVPVGLPSTLLQRRPDIASAERSVFSANREIGVAKAAFFPTVTLAGIGGFQASHTNLLSLPNTFWSLGPGVTLPIFDGGRLKARESEAYGRFRETSANYRSVVLDAFRQVEDARAQLDWLGREAKDIDTAVAASEQALDAALALYRDGGGDYLGVVTAQTALLQAQQSALQLHTRLLQADVALVRALGGGWTLSDAPSPSVSASLQTAKERQ